MEPLKTKSRHINRREFIGSTTGALLAISIPGSVAALLSGSTSIALITDLHQDVIHDAALRLQAFTQNVKKEKPDAVLQMGDFAVPKPANQSIVDAFNSCHTKALHVLGNHDTDGGHSVQQCLSFWKMEAPYYIHKVKGIWLIVLNGNEKGSPTHKGGYPSYIGPEQVRWLREKLAEIKEPAIIISHQPLAGPMAVDNAGEIQQILSSAKNKILLAINGHTHIDGIYSINGINYVHINSASYYWAGDQYKHESYAPAVHKAHPWIAYTFPYQTALFARLTINASGKEIIIKGATTQWQGPSPQMLSYQSGDAQILQENVVPATSSRRISNNNRSKTK